MRLFIKKIAKALGIIALTAIGFYLAFVVFFGMAFLGYFRPVPVGYSFTGEPCYKEKDRAGQFKSYSGFELPKSFTILLSCSEYITFQGESEYYIVFDTTTDSIKDFRQMILKDEHSSSSDWQSGSIPDNIRKVTGLNLVFDEEFNSSDIWYLALDSSNILQLLVLDPTRNRVFYSQSNYSPSRSFDD